MPTDANDPDANDPEGSRAAVLDAAVRAPSSHNTQPWLFAVEHDAIHLIADRTRALPVNDPDDPDLLASVALGSDGHEPGQGPDPAVHDAIWTRHTTRGPFDDGPVPPQVAAALAPTVEGYGPTLHVVGAEQRQALSELVEDGDRLQFNDRRWRRELASWMHPRRLGDGLVVPPIMGPAQRAAVRALDLGPLIGRTDRTVVTAAPLVAVISTIDDTPAAWLATGRGLQALLLQAAAVGIQAGYLNQPCQVDGLRDRLRDLIGDGRHPQVVLRLGPCREADTPTPRRPVADVIAAPPHPVPTG